MTDPNVPNFNPGGVKDRFDNRDYKWNEVGASSAPFDWTVGVDKEAQLSTIITVKDQNGSGSCGGQAWAYLAELLEGLNTGTYEPRSARYIYAQTWVPGGGSHGRDNCNIFVNQGVATEAVLTSYDNGRPPQEAFMENSSDITYAVRENAKLSVASSYVNVDTNIDSFAQAIRDNGGAIIGIAGSNNGTWNSAFPKAPVPTAQKWYHWVFACKAKMIDGKKHIGIINSWGTAVGEAGHQWISEDYFANPGDIFSGWTHVYRTYAPPTIPFHHLFVKELQYGMTDPEVQFLQKALTLEGCFPATVTPTLYFGNITKQAVMKFQTKKGISPVGRFGPLTLAMMNTIYG